MNGAARRLPTMEQVPITAGIRLGQLLKLVGEVGAGGEAKLLLSAGGVRVNGEPEARRGRQLAPGDVVDVEDERYELVDAG